MFGNFKNGTGAGWSGIWNGYTTGGTAVAKFGKDVTGTGFTNMLDQFKRSGKSVDDFFKGFQDGNKHFKEFMLNTTESERTVANYRAHLERLRVQQIQNGEAVQVLGLKTKIANGAMKAFSIAANAAFSIGASIIITEGIKWFTEMAQAVENAKEASSSFSTTVSEQTKTFAQNSAKIRDLQSEYEELSKGVSNLGENISLTSSEYETYKGLISQISEIMPNLTVHYNEQGEKIGFIKGQLEDLNAEYNIYKQNAAKKILYEGDEDGNTINDVISNFNNQVDIGWGGLPSYFSSRWLNKGHTKQFSNQELIEILESYKNLNKEDFGLQLGAKSNALDVAVAWGNSFNVGKLVEMSLKENGDVAFDTSMSTGRQKAAQEILGYDMSDVIEMSEEEFAQLQEKLEESINTVRSEMDNANSQLASTTITIAQSTDEYWALGKDTQYVDSILSAINDDILKNAGALDENGKLVKDKLFSYVNGIIDLVKTNDDLPTLLSRLSKVSFDNSSMSTEEIINQTKVWLTSLEEILKGHGFDEEGIKYLKLVLGFGNIEEEEQDYNAYINKLAPVKDGDGTNPKYVEDAAKRQEELREWANEYNVKTEELEKLYSRGTLFTDTTSLAQLTGALYSIRGLGSDGKLSFKKAWNNLDDTDANKEAKEELQELAEAGRLTVEAFEDSSIAEDFMKETGLSAEEATRKINKLVEETRHLSSLKTGITTITDAYDEKKNAKDNRVGKDTLNSMYDELGISEWDEKDLKVWNKYKDVAVNSKSSLKDLKKAQDDLASSYVTNGNYLANLTKNKKERYIHSLKELGIVNAEEIVTNKLNTKLEVQKNKSKALSAAKKDLANNTSAASEKFLEEATYTDEAKNALMDLIAQETIFNNADLDTTDKISALKNLAKAYLGVEAAASFDNMTTVKKGGAVNSYETISPEAAWELIQEQFVETPTTTKVKTTKGNKSDDEKDDKDKSSKDKTEYDFIQRKIDAYQRALDMADAKKENAFSPAKKGKQLSKQISTYTKLIKAYGKQYNKYMDKADSIKLSSDLKKKIREGKITGSYKDLIKKYGSKNADKITAYQDWFDKAQEAKVNQETAKTSKREARIEKIQNYVDKYDAQATLAETRSGLKVGYKAQNAQLSKQLSYLNKSYKKQIAIAEINKDTTEQKRLQAEWEQTQIDIQQQKIDNIKTQYENELGLIDNEQKDIQNEVAILEARGSIVTGGYYTSQNTKEKEKIGVLNEELDKLLAKQDGFTEYSDEWYNLQNDIQSVEDAINESNVNIISNNKALVELHDAMIDAIASNNANISSEAEFLAKLMGDNLVDEDTGNFTKEGLGVLGTYGISLETNEASASEYEKRVKEIQALIDSNSLGEFTSIEERDKAYDEYYAKWRDSLSSMYDYESKIVDLVTQKYKAQLSYLQEIIDAKKSILDEEKALRDYERNISEQTSNIATLEKQYQAIQGDTSEEGRLRQTQLLTQIDENRKELQDTEYDRYINDQQSMLDNLMSEYSDRLESLLKDRDVLLQEGITLINSTAGNIKTAIDDYATTYGYVYSDDFDEVMRCFTSEDGSNLIVSAIGSETSSITLALETQADKIIAAYKGESVPSAQTQTKETNTPKNDLNNNSTYGVDFAKGGADSSARDQEEVREEKLRNIRSWISTRLKKAEKKRKDYSYVNQKIYDANDKKVLSTANLKALADKLGVTYDNATKNGALAKALKKLKYTGFQTGGIVRASGVPRTGDHVPINVNPDETIMTQKFTEMLPTAVQVMDGLTKAMKAPEYSSVPSNVNTNTIGEVHFDVRLDNVNDPVDFAEAIKSDKKVQRVFSVAVNDLVTKGRITNNVKRY